MNAVASVPMFLGSLTAWHWLALGAVLLVLEIASTTSYLLWPGIAALLVGALQYLFPQIGGVLAVFLFAVLAVVATIVWQRSPLGRARPSADAGLNARMATYMGREGLAAADFVGGQGAILLDDTRWPAAVTDGSHPRRGDMLRVTGAEGTLLHVRAAAS